MVEGSSLPLSVPRGSLFRCGFVHMGMFVPNGSSCIREHERPTHDDVVGGPRRSKAAGYVYPSRLFSCFKQMMGRASTYGTLYV